MNITRKSLNKNKKRESKSFNEKEKEEFRLFKKFDKCRTIKCSKYIKNYKRESKSFEKEQCIKCPQKSSNAFYECSTKFYEGSNAQKLLGEVVKCSNKKCFSQKKALNKLRKRMYI